MLKGHDFEAKNGSYSSLWPIAQESSRLLLPLQYLLRFKGASEHI